MGLFPPLLHCRICIPEAQLFDACRIPCYSITCAALGSYWAETDLSFLRMCELEVLLAQDLQVPLEAWHLHGPHHVLSAFNASKIAPHHFGMQNSDQHYLYLTLALQYLWASNGWVFMSF